MSDRMSSGRPSLPVILHVGNYGEHPGGMAQVVNEYLSWSSDVVEIVGVKSTGGRRDPWSWARWLRSLGVLLIWRARRRRVAAVVHLSQRGSFIREGSLAWFARLLGIPVGVHLHGAEFVQFAARFPRLVRWVCVAAGTVFSLTDESIGVVEQLFRGRNRRPRLVKVVNAVSVPELTGPKRPVVLFCGEVGPRKGIDVLLEAWRLLDDRHPEWRLRIAGPRAADADTYDVPERVEMIGPLPHHRILALETEAMIAVLPSRHEALPMFLLESMARSCATLGTPVGQVASLLDGETGWLLPVDDAGALARGLDRLMSDDSLCDQLGRAGRDLIVRRFSAQAVQGELERFWLELLGLAAER